MILAPSPIWLQEVTKMYQLFLDYHPPDSLRKGFNLKKDFTDLLVQKFPHRDLKVLKEFYSITTNGQIRAINAKAKENKKQLRGMKNLMRTIHS